MYLTQSAIADDPSMKLRVASCAAQQGCTDAAIDPDYWTIEWRRVWAASPGWDAAWEYALAKTDNPPDYKPGADPSVVTDAQILAQVQAMMPFAHVGQPPTTPSPSASIAEA
jgi:hypothetical protein